MTKYTNHTKRTEELCRKIIEVVHKTDTNKLRETILRECKDHPDVADFLFEAIELIRATD